MQIVALDEDDDGQRSVRRGSGVVVDGERALILTSYPLVDPYRPDGTPAYSVLAVGHSAEPGDPVVLLYEAEIVAAEPDHDLAVLRAVSAYRGEPLEAAEFSAPAVRFGNSAAIQAQEELRLFGYGIRGDFATASVARAELDGTRSEFGVGGRAWLDLNARLPASMDGGGVFSAAGGFVGVLVQPRHDEAATLGTARPAALAVPLIEKARSAEPGARYRPAVQRSPLAVDSPDPAVPDIVIRGPSFAENAFDDGGRTVLFDYTRFPVAGLPALYYEFAAQGIPAGAQVEEQWFLDDVLQDAPLLDVHLDRRRLRRRDRPPDRAEPQRGPGRPVAARGVGRRLARRRGARLRRDRAAAGNRQRSQPRLDARSRRGTRIAARPRRNEAVRLLRVRGGRRRALAELGRLPATATSSRHRRPRSGEGATAGAGGWPTMPRRRWVQASGRSRSTSTGSGPDQVMSLSLGR